MKPDFILMYHFSNFTYTGFDFRRNRAIGTGANIQHNISSFIYPFHNLTDKVSSRTPVLIITVISPSVIKGSSCFPSMHQRLVRELIISHRLEVYSIITHFMNPQTGIHQHCRIQLANHSKHITHLFFRHLPLGNRICTPTVKPE